MKSEKTNIVVPIVVVVVLAVAFYMLVLSPKRAEVSDLEAEATSLEADISEQEQVISFGQQARKDFPKDYGRLVVLGKAVPDSADSASMLVSLNSMATRADVEFRGIIIAENASGEGTSSSAPVAPTPAPGAEAAPAGEEGSTEGGETVSTTTPAPVPATEGAAANLPIGAVVGTAGLPTLPYALTFKGGFFGIADYMGELDSLVHFDGDGGQVKVNGRLLTVDGFLLKGGRPGSDPDLNAAFMLTSYVTPSTQGLTAGASPGGPAPGGVQATPASTVATP